MDNIRKYLHLIVEILLSIAIVLLLISRFSCGDITTPKLNEKPLESRYDTIYLDTTIFREILIPVPDTVIISSIDTIYQDSVVFVDTVIHAVNRYRDSIAIGVGVIHWEALVRGELDGLNATFSGSVMRETVREVIRYRDRYIYQNREGFFLTAGVGAGPETGALDVGGVFLTKNGWLYGYEYDIINQNHRVKAGLKLF